GGGYFFDENNEKIGVGIQRVVDNNIVYYAVYFVKNNVVLDIDSKMAYKSGKRFCEKSIHISNICCYFKIENEDKFSIFYNNVERLHFVKYKNNDNYTVYENNF
ncbi:4542_t:CDS:1, partial [Scutellospora calospora]